MGRRPAGETPLIVGVTPLRIERILTNIPLDFSPPPPHSRVVRSDAFGAFVPASRRILLGGIVLRVVVFLFLGPTAADDHYQVIDFILRSHRLPVTGVFAQSFHPPLYSLLSIPWAALGGPRVVEAFSLLLSTANLWLLFRLIERTIERPRARIHAMLLAALLPELVLYSILVSNDTLAMLVGTLALLVALRFADAPTIRNGGLAGLVAGIALSTKGTLIAGAGVLFAVVAIGAFRRFPFRRAAWCLSLFGVLALLLGSYKFVENQIHFGRPLVHNMEFGQPWVRAQQPTITSAYSLVDFDLRKLMRRPYSELREGGSANPRSMPLLFYATFWHPYVPVSNFRGTWERTDLLAQATYLLAIVPSLLIVLGLVAGRRSANGRIAIAFLVANVALVIAVGLRFDAWSCFQSRLFFPSFAAVALAYGWGIDDVVARWPVMARWIDVVSAPLHAAFVVFYAIEIVHVTVTVLL